MGRADFPGSAHICIIQEFWAVLQNIFAKAAALVMGTIILHIIPFHY